MRVALLFNKRRAVAHGVPQVVRGAPNLGEWGVLGVKMDASDEFEVVKAKK
jgi:hypothetical protein